eukprot:7076816-Alexandrium_andersonii.AAC.1
MDLEPPGRRQQSPAPLGSGRTPEPAGHPRGHSRRRGSRPTGVGRRRRSCSNQFPSPSGSSSSSQLTPT